MKTPMITLEKAREIIKDYPTPFHIYDEKGIEDNAKELISAFSWNDGYKEYFAVKANPNPALLKILHNLGCGMDCSSKTELLLCEKLGITGSDIMFTSNETPADEYGLALKMGATITLDDLTHVDFLHSIAGKLPDCISLRYNNGRDFAVNSTIMGKPQEAKYGMTRQQLVTAIEKLKAYGVKQFGLHAFLASNNLGNDYYPTLAALLFETASELHKKTGADFKFINLSGGIGIPYMPEDGKPDINIIAAKVKDAYDKTFAGSGIKPSILTELGRYMAGPYGNLITTVLHFKHIYKEYVGVDACAANLMRPAMYGSYHHITVLGKENAPCIYTCDVVGGLCENNDKFAIDRTLPQIEIGDILAIHDSGAHGFSMGYNYNGKLRSAELLLKKDGDVKLIRRAETPEDYFATMIFD